MSFKNSMDGDWEDSPSQSRRGISWGPLWPEPAGSGWLYQGFLCSGCTRSIRCHESSSHQDTSSRSLSGDTRHTFMDPTLHTCIIQYVQEATYVYKFCITEEPKGSVKFLYLQTVWNDWCWLWLVRCFPFLQMIDNNFVYSHSSCDWWRRRWWTVGHCRANAKFVADASFLSNVLCH